jgi:hypothetical protein
MTFLVLLGIRWLIVQSSTRCETYKSVGQKGVWDKSIKLIKNQNVVDKNTPITLVKIVTMATHNRKNEEHEFK